MNRVTATHEAGHAIGRLLTAQLVGYAPKDAVSSIDLDAVCYGPLVSEDLEHRVKEYLGVEISNLGKIWAAVTRLATDAERKANMHARMLYVTMGAAAEARLGRFSDARQVYMTYACARDREDFQRACHVLRLDPARSAVAEDQFLRHAMVLIKRPPVWSAVNAIAFALRDAKSELSGWEVEALAWPHLSTDAEVLSQPMPPGWEAEKLLAPAVPVGR